jgi:hypothetical protein
MCRPLVGETLTDENVLEAFGAIDDPDCGGLLGGPASGTTTLKAQVCNRGTSPVQDGVTVRFVESDTGEIAGGRKVCETETGKLLDVGDCEKIECQADLSGDQQVFVVVDPGNRIADCHPGNNECAGTLQFCAVVE